MAITLRLIELLITYFKELFDITNVSVGCGRFQFGTDDPYESPWPVSPERYRRSYSDLTCKF